MTINREILNSVGYFTISKTTIQDDDTVPSATYWLNWLGKPLKSLSESEAGELKLLFDTTDVKDVD